MGKAELMQEKITKLRELPKEIKDKLNIETFYNLEIANFVMAFMCVVNWLYMNKSVDTFTTIIKISGIVIVVLNIVAFEFAYRKDSVRLWIHSIELLFLGLFILSVPYVYVYISQTIREILMFTGLYFAIYYVGKTIAIHIIEIKQYLNNLSDVLEILQDDTENTSYIEDIELDEEKENDD